MASRVRNGAVAKAWYLSADAINHSGTFTTDGVRLWSYKLLIGDTCGKTGKKVLRDYTSQGNHGFRSQTTSCHVGKARFFADIVD